MAGFFRTADKSGSGFRRSIPVALGTSAATATTVNPSQAHGQTGSEQCILSVGIDNSYATNPITLTCQYWSTTANQWFLAGTGVSGGTQAVSIAPGGSTTFVLPEQTLYFLYASTAVGANLVWTDGVNAPPSATPYVQTGG